MDIREEAINRVLRILDRFSQKLKISICLPTYLEKMNNEKILVNRRLEENLRKLHKLYTEMKLKESFKNDEHETSEMVVYKGEIYDLESLWIISLENLINEFPDETLDLINDSFDEILPNNRNIVHQVELLKQIVERQMKTTPKQMRERKVELRNAETVIAITQEEIEKFKISIVEETKKHDDIVETFGEEISTLEKTINEIKMKHQEEFDREMNCYKTTLSRLADDVREEKKNLENQLAAHEALVDNLIQINLEQEKLLRARCLESEKKCLEARNLYDQDLTKLTELREALDTQLSLINLHYELLKNEFDVQSGLFMNLKKEREIALMKAFAEKIDNFEKNRAARIIQHTWRAYHERVTSKKKKRSRKKH